jgi:hypothetical protein
MGDPVALTLVAFGVGIVIGLTGMGGGALMTPALIFLGVPPTAAVANDLVAAAANKTVGAVVHWRTGSPNLRLAGWLVLGSVPLAFAGAFIVRAVGSTEEQQVFLRAAIGITLLLTAAMYALRFYLRMVRGTVEAPSAQDPPVRALPTFLVGGLGGLLVGITSVGSGSVIMVCLLLIYPTLAARRLVGTDLVQAIPLVFAASVSHVIVSGVDWEVLVPLVLGGAPGTYLGARLSAVVPQSVTRRGIATVLTLTGLAMLHVPPAWVGVTGIALLVVGSLSWRLLRRVHGTSYRTDADLPGP